MHKPRSILKSSISIAFSTLQVRIAAVILLLLILFAFLTPFFTSHNYFTIDLQHKNASIGSRGFLLGSDDLGRDLLLRLSMGTKVSLVVGLFAALLDLIIGVWYGAVAAFFGKKIENGMVRLLDVLETIPYFLIVIGIIMILEPGLKAVLFALCLVSWIPTARIIRSQVLDIKTKDYILAAKAMGASSFRILWKHLFPNLTGSLIVTITLTVPLAIFAESVLSFLGFGIQAPMSSLGGLCQDGLEAMQIFPKRVILPSLCIILLMMSFTLIGEGLKQAISPEDSSQ